MKNILCYGDSNTFASHPLGGRHPYEDRFTGQLQRQLGSDYRVIEEGCGGRTTVFEDEVEAGRNGKTFLPTCIASHNPLDLIILMLGTNDLKHRINPTLWDLGKAMEQLLRIIDSFPYAPHYKKPQVLIVSPIHIGDDVESSPFGCFTREAVEKSHHFAEVYGAVAQAHGAYFLDAAQVHMDRESHAALADALEQKVREILG